MINLCFSQLYPPILEQVSQRLVPSINQLVYCDWQDEVREMIHFSDEENADSRLTEETKRSLNPEQWWSDYLELGEIQEVALESGNIYIYPFGKTPFHQYWLLFLDRSLSEDERSHFQLKGNQLRQYLELYRQNQQQATKIKLLEHVIQRTQHQLQHPLNLIKLYANNIQHTAADLCHKDNAQTIGNVADELSKHLSDLLAYGKGEHLTLEVHNLRDVLSAAIQDLTPLIQDYQVIVDYPKQDAIATIDVWKIKQVFENLLSNAIYFSPRGSHIYWDWQVFQNEILVTIEDQGPGLSEQDLCHIFQPFYSQRQGGQGIGLAVAKKIILDHQGHLWATNSPQGGAKFSFAIPIT